MNLDLILLQKHIGEVPSARRRAPRVFKDPKGYLFFYGYTPERRKVFIHRVVAEMKIGRTLFKNEAVHHVDQDKENNSWENLEIMTRKDHAKHHSKEIEFWKGSPRHKKEERSMDPKRGKMTERLMVPGCKPDTRKRYEGSNPFLSNAEALNGDWASCGGRQRINELKRHRDRRERPALKRSPTDRRRGPGQRTGRLGE